jgi:hypothetical protein
MSRRAVGLIAHHVGPLDNPLAVEVVQHRMLGATVVPHGDCPLAPPVADGETGLVTQLVNKASRASLSVWLISTIRG